MTNNILISSDRFEQSQSWPSSIVLTSSYAVDSDWWINEMMDLRVDRNASQTLLNCQINHLISTFSIRWSVFKRSSPRDRNLIDSILRLCQYSWSPLQLFSWLPLRGQWRGCRTINDYIVCITWSSIQSTYLTSCVWVPKMIYRSCGGKDTNRQTDSNTL